MYVKIITRMFVAVTTLSCCSVSLADETPASTYSSLVDDAGNISLPGNYRSDWLFLGTWSIAAEDAERGDTAGSQGAAGLHNVYTQRGVAEYFRKNGEFPDGAVLVKELLKADTASMTTGTVSRGVEVEGWFVMVKDAGGRFDSNPLWGDGWGWAFFGADDSSATVTRNYKTECIGCHLPARDDDWIYLSGYPILAD